MPTVILQFTDNATFEVDDNGFLYITPSGGKTVIKNDLIIRDDVSNDTVVRFMIPLITVLFLVMGPYNHNDTCQWSNIFNGGNVGIGNEHSKYIT